MQSVILPDRLQSLTFWQALFDFGEDEPFGSERFRLAVGGVCRGISGMVALSKCVHIVCALQHWDLSNACGCDFFFHGLNLNPHTGGTLVNVLQSAFHVNMMCI